MMTSLKFPDFSQSPFSDDLERLLIKTGNKDEREDSTKFQYFLSLCRYSCLLPEWNLQSNQFIKSYEWSLLDVELKIKMENLGILQSSQFTIPLFPVAVLSEYSHMF